MLCWIGLTLLYPRGVDSAPFHYFSNYSNSAGIWSLWLFNFSALVITLLLRSVRAKSEHPSRNGSHFKVAPSWICSQFDHNCVDMLIHQASSQNFQTAAIHLLDPGPLFIPLQDKTWTKPWKWLEDRFLLGRGDNSAPLGSHEKKILRIW